MQNGSGPGQGDGNGPDARADGPEARADGPEARADGPDARAWPDGQSGLVPLDGEGAPEQPDILDARLSPDGEGAPDGRDALVSPDAEGGPGLRASLEAIMLVADEPVSEIVIAQVLERPRAEVADALRELAASYAAEQRGFELREVAGGWRFYTCEECAPVVERFVSDGQEVRLTQAALETLAVVAYRQPVSRARVSAVRGVNCDGVIRTLVLRGLVEEAGTDPETGAILFATTGYFLERLGLPGLDALPELAPFLPDHIDDEADASHEPAES
jgi:segregation and condensation protein B